MFPFDPPETIRGFLMFLGASKRNNGKKRVNVILWANQFTKQFFIVIIYLKTILANMSQDDQGFITKHLSCTNKYSHLLTNLFSLIKGYNW